MNVLNPRNDLLEELAGLLLLELLALDNVFKKFSPRSVLHDQEQLSRSFNNLYTMRES